MKTFPSPPVKFPLNLLTVLLFAGAALALRAQDAPAPAQDSANPNQDAMRMEQFEERFEKAMNKPHYARIGDFEILSCLGDDKMAGDIVQKALQIISVFEARSPLFHINHELPTTIILMKHPRFGGGPATHPLTVMNRMNGLQAGSSAQDLFASKEDVSSQRENSGEQSHIGVTVIDDYDGNSDNYYAVRALVDAYFDLCFLSRGIKWSNLSYTFASAKILSLDISERRKSGYQGAELINPALGWYSLGRSGVLIRRFDNKRERDLFQSLASDYDKSNGDIPSKFMAAPALALRDVLERPDMFRISYNDPRAKILNIPRSTMRQLEDCMTYKRQISDFALYCVFSPDEQIRSGYVTLLNATKKEPLSEELFIKCFGKNYADFSEGMSAFYRDLGKDNDTGKASAWGAPQFTISFPDGKPPPLRPEFRDATRGECARMITEEGMADDWLQHPPDKAMQLAGCEMRYAWARKSGTQADTDPEFLASLGLYKAHTGDKAGALPLLEKAAALGTTRPAAYRELARLRCENLSRAKAENSNNNNARQFSPEEIASVIAPIETALGNPRHDIETYVTLALAWADLGAKPPDATLQTLTNACLKNPDNFRLLAAAIPLLIKNGRQDSADKVFASTANCVLTSQESALLEKLRQGALLPSDLPSPDAPPLLVAIEAWSKGAVKKRDPRNPLPYVSMQLQPFKGGGASCSPQGELEAPPPLVDSPKRPERHDPIGKPLDMQFTAVDGRHVDLSQMKGKVVLIVFWATWCGPCVGEIPSIKECYDKYHSKGFEVVGISLDDDKDKLESFTRKMEMPWPQYFDGKQWGTKFAKQYGITSLPDVWLVDKKGNLRATKLFFGFAGLAKKLLDE